MKKITLLATILFGAAPLIVKAQFSCANAVALTNGYSAANVTTPGLGAGSPGAWVTQSMDCQGTGGQSSTLGDGSTCWNQVFDTVGDDYVFSYTTGDVPGETVFFEILTRQSYVGIMAFTGCDGTALSGCLSGAYSAGVDDDGATLSVTATDLPANQTVYFGIGVWTLPNDLDFDVTNFTVTMPLATDETIRTKTGVFPNPVGDILHFSNVNSNCDVMVYDLMGQKVVSQKSLVSSQMDLSGLPAGTYLVKVDSGQETQTFRILKK
jgi:hypothetical protein